VSRDEFGDVYALDLGGTNFRVKHVKLSKAKSQIESEEQTEVSIPKVCVAL
jgi:hexokinase